MLPSGSPPQWRLYYGVGRYITAGLTRHPIEVQATLALSSGVNPRIVSGRLGHSTVALTLDIYSHVLPQADAEAAERIAALVVPQSR